MKLFFCIIITTAMLSGSLNASSQSISDRSIHLTGDTVSMHFVVHQHYPFIETNINGVKGLLMFDTGSGFGLTLNDAIIPLKNGKTIGRGFTGSGQSFDTHMYDTVQTVSIGGRLSVANGGPIIGFDINFMSSITSNILGMIGYQFFEGYIFKLDYKHGLITFYKNTSERRITKDFIKEEKVIGEIRFEQRKLVNIPVVPLISKSDTLAVLFDTGQLGTLYLNDDLKKIWVDNGTLILPGDGSEKVNVKSLVLPGGLKTAPGNVLFSSQQNATAHNQSIGVTEANSIALGYGFLSQYKTVWDYQARIIYLLER